ncbi:MAG: ACT domain-containing protein [Butyrivibrio sp.]|nr:ACT domain-containing protein [Butyrivibrio sp.]
MNRVIITVVGKDTVGIIAKVCTYLAENRINILDISQTIVQDYFNMMMIVDADKSEKALAEVITDLDEIGNGIGVVIKCQREEIFDKMHRI